MLILMKKPEALTFENIYTSGIFEVMKLNKSMKMQETPVDCKTLLRPFIDLTKPFPTLKILSFEPLNKSNQLPKTRNQLNKWKHLS